MDISKVLYELYIYASSPRVFTFDELVAFADPSVNRVILREAILNKSKFLLLQTSSSNGHHFILDSVLFQWFSRLNFRLASKKQYKLYDRQVASSLSQLRSEGRWYSTPQKVISWGKSLGLISPSYTDGKFNFPFAQVLARMDRITFELSIDLLSNFYEEHIWNSSLRKRRRALLIEGFSKFDKQTFYIVMGREGFITGKKITLQNLGNKYSLTRERIRQLENQFWTSLIHNKNRLPFLEAFICEFMSTSGSLIIRTDSSKAPLRLFLVKCAGIPRVELNKIGFIIITALPKDLAILRSKNLFPNEISFDAVAKLLESKCKIPFSRKDIHKLANELSKYRQNRLKTIQRVYIALDYIGKPAHYTKITEVYNSLWPNKILSEHIVHNALNKSRYGIVWIGVKGTYALKKWGYEKPSMTLFDTVDEIVRKKYRETGLPVPLAIIVSELGRYRKVIHPVSLTIVTQNNPRIKRVMKDCFIPREFDDQTQEQLSLDELDKIIKDFKREA